MRQSRLMSLVEAVTNVAVGYGVAVVTQLLVFPMFGLVTTLGQNLAIGAIFTTVSLARSYVLRRAVRALRERLPRSGLGRVADDPPTGRAVKDWTEEAESVAPALGRCGG